MRLKSLSVMVVSTFVLASLVASASAQSKTKPRVPGAQLASVPVGGSSSHKDVWARCQSNYDGQRYFLGRERYAYLEQCFHNETGKYPHQVQLNCTINRC
jgi:hypothetical protein